VELQSRLGNFEAAGTVLFGISYDPVSVLAEFADQFGITYPLLSDEGSKTIERLGLLNQHVAEQQAYYGIQVAERHRGIPYPGIFFLDEQGIVVDRQFDQSYRVRPAPDVVIEELLAATVAPSVSAEEERSGVRIRAWLGSSTYNNYERLNLHVQLELAPNLHVYAPGAPEGFIPLEITIAPIESMVVEPATLPKPQVLRIEGIDEEYPVYEGTIMATVPFHIDSDQGAVSLQVAVQYQACTDSMCYPPDEMRLELPIGVRPMLRPG